MVPPAFVTAGLIAVLLLAPLRLFCGCLGLVLTAPGCSSVPEQAPVVAQPTHLAPVLVAEQAASPVPEQEASVVAPIIRALLDTTGAGSPAAADTRRGLQAGPDVRAFFGSDCAPAWTGPADTLNADGAAALALLARTPEFGLRPIDYGLPGLLALRDSLARPAAPATAAAPPRARQQARLEVALSDAVLRLMRDLSRGRLRPYPGPGTRPGGAGLAPAAALRAALATHTVPAAVAAAQPAHREYRQLQQALARWLAQPAPPDSAARRQAQYEQVALNLERWRWDPIPEREYVLINIPAYELQVVTHDSVQQRHRVIVGRPDTPTPTLDSRIGYFTLAPDWHVPHSIATKEVLPRLKKDPGYLASNNMALYDDRGRTLNPWRIAWGRVSAQDFKYTVRQSGGCENALGNVVFRFPNPYSVYLHDTPTRQLFDRPDRALSHGCIRLAEPPRLAAYLLRREGRPVQLPSEFECARQLNPRDVRLRRPIPLYVRYATCTADRGRLQCLPDVYHRDEPLRLALFGPRP